MEMRAMMIAAAMLSVAIIGGARIVAYSAEKSTADPLDFGKREY